MTGDQSGEDMEYIYYPPMLYSVINYLRSVGKSLAPYIYNENYIYESSNS